MHCCSDLIQIFNNLFRESHRTLLVKGGEEPLYQPARSSADYHQVIFARGYFASALHEISHWCIAGERRRLMVDYGYWYAPDGRSPRQQREFEQVEIKPQALEWIFSVAAGHPFHLSIDNLGGAAYNRPVFADNVYRQVRQYLNEGIPGRARAFTDGLVDFYGGRLAEELFDRKLL